MLTGLFFPGRREGEKNNCRYLISWHTHTSVHSLSPLKLMDRLKTHHKTLKSLITCQCRHESESSLRETSNQAETDRERRREVWSGPSSPGKTNSSTLLLRSGVIWFSFSPPPRPSPRPKRNASGKQPGSCWNINTHKPTRKKQKHKCQTKLLVRLQSLFPWLTRGKCHHPTNVKSGSMGAGSPFRRFSPVTEPVWENNN